MRNNPRFSPGDKVILKDEIKLTPEPSTREGEVIRVTQDREEIWVTTKLSNSEEVTFPEGAFKPIDIVTTTHVAIILDKSGSMNSVRAETLSGFNEQVQTIKDSDKGLTKVTLTTFNSEVETHYFEEGIENLKELELEDYQPRGGTAMLDAVGKTLERLKEETDFEDTENHRYLILIMSDGWENASKEYTYESIAETIQELQESRGNWTFTYMGSNQDLSELSERLAIPKGNMSFYTSDAEGTLDAFRSMSVSTMSYMAADSIKTGSFYEEEAGQ